MRAKLTALGLMAMLIAMLTAMSVSAEVACTSAWITPAATGTTITGTAYKFNISMACNATNNGGIRQAESAGNITSVNISYKLTTASTWTDVNTSDIYNNTRIADAKGAEFRTNFNTAPLYDHLTYQIRARGYNGSGSLLLTETSLAAIYIDNHNPGSAPASSIAVGNEIISNGEKIELGDTLSFSVPNATACTVRVFDTDTIFKEFTGTVDRTDVGNEKCSYKFNSYDLTSGVKRFVNLLATEELGSSADTTTTTLEYIEFQKPTSTARRAALDQAGELEAAAATQTSSSPDLVKIAAIAVLVYGAYYVLKKRR